MASRVVCMKRFHQQAFLKIGVLLRFCSRDSFWIKALSSLGNTQFSLTSSFESRFSFLSKAFCVNINVHFSINKFFLILAHQPLFFDQCHVVFSKSFRSCTHVCGNTWPHNYIITECPLDCVSFRSWESHCRMRWPKPESRRQRNFQTKSTVFSFNAVLVRQERRQNRRTTRFEIARGCSDSRRKS